MLGGLSQNVENSILVRRSYFYFLMEWIFFATKPSFMSSLAVPEKISALVIPPGLFSIAFIGAIALLRLLSGVIESTLGFNIFSRTAPLLPALPLAACLFILVDNFTYTLFHYGVISTDGLPLILYRVWFLFLLLVTYLFFHRKANALASSASRRGLTALAGILLLISAVDAVRALASNTRSPGMATTAHTAPRSASQYPLGFLRRCGREQCLGLWLRTRYHPLSPRQDERCPRLRECLYQRPYHPPFSGFDVYRQTANDNRAAWPFRASCRANTPISTCPAS